MKPSHNLSLEQKMAGVCFAYPSLFMRSYWKDELTLPMSTRQKVFVNDLSDKVMACLGRKVVKSLTLEARVIRTGITTTDAVVDERMIVTPGEKQMDFTMERLQSRMNKVPLFRLLNTGFNRGKGIIKFAGGVTYYARIEGTSGTDANMQGLRAREIIGDEMQGSSTVCHTSRTQTAQTDCKWFYAGVPDNRYDTIFYKLDQTNEGSEWSRHHMSTYANPRYWSEKERAKLIKSLGGKHSLNYLNLALGLWGSRMLSSFPPESIAYHNEPFAVSNIGPDDIPQSVSDQLAYTQLIVKLNIPLPKKKSVKWIMGMDYGNLQDPTEIALAYCEDDKLQDWKQACRIEVRGADQVKQARLIQCMARLLGMNNVLIYCLDLVGYGHGVAAVLNDTRQADYWRSRVVNFQSGGMIEVPDPFEEKEGEEESEVIFGKRKETEPTRVSRKQYYTQLFQAAMLAARTNSPADIRLWIGHDEEAVNELIQTRERKRGKGIEYLPPQIHKNQPIDHNCLVAGTMVRTDRGDRAIETIRAGDRVLTRDGYHAVIAAGLSNPNIPIWEVEFSNGVTLRGTHNHPVWVRGHGFNPIDGLSIGDIIEVSHNEGAELCGTGDRRRERLIESYSMGLSSGVTRKRRAGQIEGTIVQAAMILLAELRRCIERFGNSTTGTFQTDAIFIIRILTTSTIPLTTLSAYRKGNILGFIRQCQSLMSTKRGRRKQLTMPESSQANGISQKKEGLGTHRCPATLGVSASPFRRFVSFVESRLIRWISGEGIATAPITAKIQTIAVLSVKEKHYSAPVFNLTVEGSGEYFANGVLVHNTDMYRSLVCAASEAKLREGEDEEQDRSEGYAMVESPLALNSSHLDRAMDMVRSMRSSRMGR